MGHRHSWPGFLRSVSHLSPEYVLPQLFRHKVGSIRTLNWPQRFSGRCRRTGRASVGAPPIGFDDEDLAATKSLGNEGLAATGSAIKPVRAIPDTCEDIPRDGARLFG